jgi:glycosyltransferase involved in cell wall biosynthesis
VGVYDGEEGKERDFAASLPPALVGHLAAHCARGGRAVILAEEWHTAHAVVHLDGLLRQARLRERVEILWNANNTFGFERVPWQVLRRAATLTTVSRYMRQRMWPLGVDPVVIPNGLEPEAYLQPSAARVQKLRRLLAGRMLLAKVARWDPDKRWLSAVDAVGELRRRGARPLLVARGGAEAHGAEVITRARMQGLRVTEGALREEGEGVLLELLADASETDVLVVRSHLAPEPRRLLFCAAHAVLVNSGHEPFGLVGLETMAVGGLACTGGTGEDYAQHGRNGLVLQSDDPAELLRLLARLRDEPGWGAEIRRNARRTARDYSWSEVIRRNLRSRLALRLADPMRETPAAERDLAPMRAPRSPAATRQSERLHIFHEPGLQDGDRIERRGYAAG